MADAVDRGDSAHRLPQNRVSNENRWITELHQALEERVIRMEERLASSHCNFIHGYCKSPIEQLIAPWLLSLDVRYLEAPICVDGAIALDQAIEVAPIDEVSVFAQVRVAAYTADFLIVMKYEGKNESIIQLVAIECDGHEFHSRTKTQAEHDRKRDRAFQALGINVFRFTGSEIFRSPQGCAEEIGLFLSDKIEHAWGIK